MEAKKEKKGVTGTLLGLLPTQLDDELFETLATSGQVRIERILSNGQASPPDFWYDQAENEFVLLVQGLARLEFEGGGLFELRPGDYVDIPSHQRHRVDWTDPDQVTVWLAVFY